MSQNTSWYLCYVIASFLAIFAAQPLAAQTMSIDSVSAPDRCDTAQVIVYYSASGTFGAKNVFTVQLSAEDGSFTNYFTNAGSLKTTTSGSIAITVPHGTTWRVRLSSSNPYTLSSVYANPIVVHTSPNSYIEASAGNILLGNTVQFHVTDWAHLGLSYAWSFGSDATPSTSTDTSVTVTYATVGQKIVSLTTSDGSCTNTITKPVVNVFSCNPAIPSTAIIDSDTYQDSLFAPPVRNIWVVPGASLTLPYYTTRTVFAEAGTSIDGGSGGRDTIYLKAGAVYRDQNSGNVIIYEPGASLVGSSQSIRLECSSLNFDYSNAPVYKILHSAEVTSRVSVVAHASVYPNPSTNMIAIDCSEMVQWVSIRNELGEEMLHDAAAFQTKSRQYDLSRFAAGTYYVELGLPTHSERLKFSVTR